MMLSIENHDFYKSSKLLFFLLVCPYILRFYPHEFKSSLLKTLCVFGFSYIANLEENAPEGTILKFEGGLDMVEDLDKV